MKRREVKLVYEELDIHAIGEAVRRALALRSIKKVKVSVKNDVKLEISPTNFGREIHVSRGRYKLGSCTRENGGFHQPLVTNRVACVKSDIPRVRVAQIMHRIHDEIDGNRLQCERCKGWDMVWFYINEGHVPDFKGFGSDSMAKAIAEHLNTKTQISFSDRHTDFYPWVDMHLNESDSTEFKIKIQALRH